MQKVVEQYHGKPLQRPLEAAFHKLPALLDAREAYSVADLEEELSFRPFAPGAGCRSIRDIDARGAREIERWVLTCDGNWAAGVERFCGEDDAGSRGKYRES